MDFDRETRGFRNNNLGNIKHGDPWSGLASTQDDDVFCTFKSIEWGLRALYRIMATYDRYYDLRCVRSIIERYAPSSENETKNYVNFCVKHINSYGLTISSETDIFILDDVVDLLVSAIIKFENGIQPFSIDFIQGCKDYDRARASSFHP